MREEDFAGLRVDMGRIGLEAALSGKSISNGHSQQCRQGSFASGRYAFRIQKCQCQSTGVSEGLQKVEASEGKA